MSFSYTFEDTTRLLVMRAQPGAPVDARFDVLDRFLADPDSGRAIAILIEATSATMPASNVEEAAMVIVLQRFHAKHGQPIAAVNASAVTLSVAITLRCANPKIRTFLDEASAREWLRVLVT